MLGADRVSMAHAIAMQDPAPKPRSSLRIWLAVAVALAGGIWMLQGLGILTGRSFMVGDPLWAWLGALGVVIGIAFIAFELRRRPDRPG